MGRSVPLLITDIFLDLAGAVHHWDENGLADLSKEPPVIQQIHSQEVAFVKAWLQERT